MILPQTNIQLLILMIVSLICLGAWGITYKSTQKWRFELYYLDFAMGAVVLTILYAVTLGSMGFDGFAFYDDMAHSSKRAWIFGLAAGIVFNLANMFLVASMSVAGMTVAFPVGLGIALVFGVGLGHVLRQQGAPIFLFAGLGLIAAAILIAGFAYAGLIDARTKTLIRQAREAGKRTVDVPGAAKGLVLALAGGVIMLGYAPLLARARVAEQGLGAYSAVFMVAMGLFFSTLIFTVFFANLPVQGEPVELTRYFKGSLKTHCLGVLGGMLWSTGTLAAVVATAGAKEGEIRLDPAVSLACTFGVPVVAGICGLTIFGEFREAGSRAKTLAVVMLALFAAGVALVSVAPLYFKPAV